MVLGEADVIVNKTDKQPAFMGLNVSWADRRQAAEQTHS